MNQTWIRISNADKTGARLYSDTFLVKDLFLNNTLDDGNIYQSWFFSSTVLSRIIGNNSNINQSSIRQPIDSNGISSSIEKIILTFLMSTMAFLTVFGNSLVIIAFICEPTIRTYSNYFILNLSIADLLIGIIW
jgi:hypothetical protein